MIAIDWLWVVALAGTVFASATAFGYWAVRKYVRKKVKDCGVYMVVYFKEGGGVRYRFYPDWDTAYLNALAVCDPGYVSLSHTSDECNLVLEKVVRELRIWKLADKKITLAYAVCPRCYHDMQYVESSKRCECPQCYTVAEHQSVESYIHCMVVAKFS